MPKKHSQWPFAILTIVLIVLAVWFIVTVLQVPDSHLASSILSPDATQTKTAPVIQKVNVGQILENPANYNNKIVRITGNFGGWKGNEACDSEKMFMKTRQDTIVYDKTGCLYMTGGVKDANEQELLDPLNKPDLDRAIEVVGVVRVIDNKPILARQTVEERVAKLPETYKNLSQKCNDALTLDCCLASIESMVSGNFQPTNDQGLCDSLNDLTTLSCEGSLSWCMPNYIEAK